MEDYGKSASFLTFEYHRSARAVKILKHVAKGEGQRVWSLELWLLDTRYLMLDTGFLWVGVAQPTKPFRIRRLSRVG